MVESVKTAQILARLVACAMKLLLERRVKYLFLVPTRRHVKTAVLVQIRMILWILVAHVPVTFMGKRVKL